ncbi:MAG: hypothetical protein ACYDER_16240 [Ktedonobacteraceae bacterium]
MVLLLALLLLSGCGQSPSPSSSSSTQILQKTPTSAHSGSATPTSGPAPLGTGVAFDLGGWLHIQSASGFACGFTSNGLPITPGSLVLPTVLPSYDQGTLQAMKNYLTAANQSDAFVLDTVPYPAFPTNTSAFQLAAVNMFGGPFGSACGETLHITNIGNAPVQVAQVSTRLVADTQTNTQHYNLVDLCSIAASSICFPRGGGEAGYLADFNLGAGKANTTIPPISWGSGGRSGSAQTLSLKPGEVAKVQLLYSATNNLSFSLFPTFTLDWPGKQQTYAAPQLQTTFAFAAVSQFSCYALQGQQFMQVPVDAAHWCM